MPERDSRRRRSRSRSPRRRHRFSRSTSPSNARLRSRSPRHDERRTQDHRRRRRRRRSRSISSDARSRSRSRSRSHSPSRSSRHIKHERSRKPLPSQDESFRRGDHTSNQIDAPKPKEKPNFNSTGLLAAETNKVNIGSGKNAQSIVLKYHEPPEARKPPMSERWLVYVFKGASKEPLHTYYLHERTCWLLGRELAVADIPVEHPSCSKQHAIFQFRHTVKTNEWGEKKDKIGLYLLDLESANGTFLNGERIDAARYTQCLSGDIVKFGESEREYVILLPPKD